jgi:hypothetical protein
MLKYFLVCPPAYLFQPSKISKLDLVIHFSIGFPEMTIAVNVFEYVGINNHQSISKQTYSMITTSLETYQFFISAIV